MFVVILLKQKENKFNFQLQKSVVARRSPNLQDNTAAENQEGTALVVFANAVTSALITKQLLIRLNLNQI